MVRHPHGLRPLHEPAFGKPEEELVGGPSPGGDPVRHVQVEETVAVHVGHRRGEAVGAAQHPRGRRDIHEAAAVVAIEAVVILAVPAVAGHVEVGVAVPVVVEKERGPPAARIEERGVESRGREGRGAVLAQAVSVERVRVPDAEGQADPDRRPRRKSAQPLARARDQRSIPTSAETSSKRTGDVRAAIRKVQPVALR